MAQRVQAYTTPGGWKGWILCHHHHLINYMPGMMLHPPFQGYIGKMPRSMPEMMLHPPVQGYIYRKDAIVHVWNDAPSTLTGKHSKDAIVHAWNCSIHPYRGT